MRGLAETVPWKRFWIPREKAPALGSDGYLVDPEEGYGNYDSLVESVEGPPVRTPYTWMESDKALGDIKDARKVLFKIHGTANREDTVVMTKPSMRRPQSTPLISV